MKLFGITFYKISKWYERFFSKEMFYLYAMTVYHIQILLFVTFLGVAYENTKTFLPMILPDKAGGLTFLNYSFSITDFNALFFTFVILVVDFAFLFIVQKEIVNYEKKHNKLPFTLTTNKIIIIEVLVLWLSMGNPFMRAGLYFISFNTIQIYVTYRIIFPISKVIPFCSIIPALFILNAYVAILKLGMYPLIEVWRIHWIAQSLTP